MTSNTEETATPKLLQRASRRRPASRNVRARLRPPRPSRRSPLTSSPTGRFRDSIWTVSPVSSTRVTVTFSTCSSLGGAPTQPNDVVGSR